MLCVYDDPQLAAMRVEFAPTLEEALSIFLAGCLARWPAT
jgi:hypothetical protein